MVLLPLFDRLDQPAGIADIIRQELAGRLVPFFVFQKLSPVAADVQIFGRLVHHLDFVLVGFFIIINPGIGNDRMSIFTANLLAGVGVQRRGDLLDRSLQIVNRAIKLFADLRIPIHLDVFEMLGHQGSLELEIVTFPGAGIIGFQCIELDQQAFPQVASSNPRRFKRLHEPKGGFKVRKGQRSLRFLLNILHG